jgi:hypothetical protein
MSDQPKETVEIGFTLHLQDDFHRCTHFMFEGEEKDRQFWRRMTCRALFGWLESVLAVCRNHFAIDMFRERHKELFQENESKTYFMSIHLATEPHE